MSSNLPTREELLTDLEQCRLQLYRTSERLTAAEHRLQTTDLAERAALSLWGRVAIDLVLLRDGQQRMPEEYIAEIAARCWYAAEIFDRVAALPHGPQKKGGG